MVVVANEIWYSACMNMQQRSNQNINLGQFAYVNQAEKVTGPYRINYARRPESQYILRMLLGKPGEFMRIPNEINWLFQFMEDCYNYQHMFSKLKPENYWKYLTVRCGPVNSTGDDIWHVDGFSTRIPHVPEHNYIWCDKVSTEYINEAVYIPNDFDPLKHNLHKYLDKAIENKYHRAERMMPYHIYRVDPYVIHRRIPNVNLTGSRVFLRMTFSAIQIKDDINTPNPLIPVERFNNVDFRHSLVDYA